MPKVLPNPSSVAFHKRTPSAESKPTGLDRDDHNHLKPKETENEQLGNRKLSNGSTVSNLRDKFNNNNKPDVSPRPSRPSIPGKSSAVRPTIPSKIPQERAVQSKNPPERAVPSLPKRVQPSNANNIPTPSIPTRPPVVELETLSVAPPSSTSKRWPPVQTNNNTNTVEPPPVIKPVMQPAIPKPVEPVMRKPAVTPGMSMCCEFDFFFR